MARDEGLIRVLAVIPIHVTGVRPTLQLLSLSLELKTKMDSRTKLGRQTPPALGVVEVEGSVAANVEGFLLGVV